MEGQTGGITEAFGMQKDPNPAFLSYSHKCDRRKWPLKSAFSSITWHSKPMYGIECTNAGGSPQSSGSADGSHG